MWASTSKHSTIWWWNMTINFVPFSSNFSSAIFCHTKSVTFTHNIFILCVVTFRLIMWSYQSYSIQCSYLVDSHPAPWYFQRCSFTHFPHCSLAINFALLGLVYTHWPKLWILGADSGESQSHCQGWRWRPGGDLMLAPLRRHTHADHSPPVPPVDSPTSWVSASQKDVIQQELVSLSSNAGQVDVL